VPERIAAGTCGANARATLTEDSMSNHVVTKGRIARFADYMATKIGWIDKEEWKAIAQRLRDEAGMDERRRPMSPRGFSKITAADITPYIQRIVAATFLDDMDLARRRVGALLSTAKRTCVIEALSGKHYAPRFDRMLRFEVYNGRKIVVTLWYDGRKE
jgi:hypothetical protein